MAERLTSSGDDLARALEALTRVEKAVPDTSMRRTAAEIGGAESAPEMQAEIDRLTAENESLRSRLSTVESGGSAVKREAAQLAVRVDRALEQLDLIEKG
jgi:MoxR-like ATPase